MEEALIKDTEERKIELQEKLVALEETKVEILEKIQDTLSDIDYVFRHTHFCNR